MPRQTYPTGREPLSWGRVLEEKPNVRLTEHEGWGKAFPWKPLELSPAPVHDFFDSFSGVAQLHAVVERTE